MAMTVTQYKEVFRKFLKDHEALNRLLNFQEENKDDMLEIYLEMALGFLNAVPPFIVIFGASDFPIPSLLIHQATIEALISNSVLSARNDLTYNNGGITVKAQDAQRYTDILTLLMRRADIEIHALAQLKVSMNVNAGWGHSSSPYLRLHYQLTLYPNSIL